jgi:hypothetical protein
MRRLLRVALAALAAVACGLAACGGGEKVDTPLPAAADRIDLTSAAFEDGGEIPKTFTCDGDDVSPPLEWSGVPVDARQLALIVDDPDAGGGTFVHWTVFGIASPVTRFEQGKAPPGAGQGENSSGDEGYKGPCPPEGDDPHRYVFALYALSKPLDLDDGASPEDVRSAVAGAALSRGRLTGRYGR